MLQQIKGEQPFQVLNNAFSISPSNEGYQLQISSDGFNYTTLFSVGPNVTRLVTGVAAGSYYRLLGNNSDVVINWRKSCSGGEGGGGEYILPVATADVLGGVKIGSGITIDSEGHISAQGGGAGDILLSVSGLPTEAQDGSVVALAESTSAGTEYGLYQAQGTYPEMEWQDYAQGGATGWTAYRTSGYTGWYNSIFRYADSNDTVVGTIGISWQPNNDIYNVADDDNDFTVVKNADNDYTATLNSDPSAIAHIYKGEDGMGYIMLTNLKYQSDKWEDGVKNAQIGVANPQGGQPIWTPVGGGEGAGVPVVSSLRDAEAVAAPVGSVVAVYSDSARTLYQKVSGGTIGHWEGLVSDGQNTAFHLLYENLEDFLDFTDGKRLFQTKSYWGEDYYNAVVDKANLRINLMTTDSSSTIAYVEYLGPEATFRTPAGTGLNHLCKVKWEKDGLYFYNGANMFYLRNYLDLSTNGIYFKKIEDPSKANRQELGFTGNTGGIPKWNSDGVIVGKDSEASGRGVWFNTTANTSSQKAIILMSSNGNNFPERIYVPTAAGAEGQILTFAGATSAPVWTSWIKSVSITQDEYDALVEAGTTDPNTLYLIVD